jgi:hypothetical protein
MVLFQEVLKEVGGPVFENDHYRMQRSQRKGGERFEATRM